MIVEPDFPSHWKTKMLIALTGDKASPLMVIRLWAHCQQRKAWNFPSMSNEVLKAICEWAGESALLRRFLTECGFIEDDATRIRVHEWELANASLVANWENGQKGGRPKRNPSKPKEEIGLFPELSSETQSKPANNPSETQAKPIDNPTVTNLKPIEEIEEIEKIEKIESIAGSESSETSVKTETGRKIHLADDEFVAELEKIYGKEAVVSAVKGLKAWLLTPRGYGKKLTRDRLAGWISRNSQKPLEIGEQRDKRTGLKFRGGRG